MAKKNQSLTRQGVRNLDSIPSKPSGRVLPEPPSSTPVECAHRRTYEVQVGREIYDKCEECGNYLFPNGGFHR